MPQDKNSAEIDPFEAAQAIRLRPAMYLGGELDDPATVTRMLIEGSCLALDNALSECATKVGITLNENGVVTIWDDGNGLDMNSEGDEPSPAEKIFTQLYACREMKKSKIHAKELCGSGIVVVNALSEWLIYETVIENDLWSLRYERGQPVTRPQKTGISPKRYQQLEFKVDDTIFGEHQVTPKPFVGWLSRLSLKFDSADISLRKADGSILAIA